MQAKITADNAGKIKVKYGDAISEIELAAGNSFNLDQ